MSKRLTQFIFIVVTTANTPGKLPQRRFPGVSAVVSCYVRYDFKQGEKPGLYNAWGGHI